MTHRFIAPASMATLLILTTTAAVAAESPGSMSSDQGWSAVSRCAQEDTERARHTCVDRVLRDAGLLTNEMRATQQRRVFGLNDKASSATPPAPKAAAPAAAGASTASGAPAATTPPATTRSSAASAAPASTAAASTAPAPSASANAAPAAKVAAAEPSDPDRLDVELTKVEKAVNGRLAVTTNEGAVWLQTESVSMPIPPVAGDRMSIRKGALGGYRCTVASTHLTYRCIRNR